nr:CRISPR-associated endonuclease Cas2 [Neisseria sp. KH1003-01]
MKQNWLIAYDITDRKRLGRAYRFLSGQALHL